jgi:hypothetical protein
MRLSVRSDVFGSFPAKHIISWKMLRNGPRRYRCFVVRCVCSYDVQTEHRHALALLYQSRSLHNKALAVWRRLGKGEAVDATRRDGVLESVTFLSSSRCVPVSCISSLFTCFTVTRA